MSHVWQVPWLSPDLMVLRVILACGFLSAETPGGDSWLPGAGGGTLPAECLALSPSLGLFGTGVALPARFLSRPGAQLRQPCSWSWFLLILPWKPGHIFCTLTCGCLGLVAQELTHVNTRSIPTTVHCVTLRPVL